MGVERPRHEAADRAILAARLERIDSLEVLHSLIQISGPSAPVLKYPARLIPTEDGTILVRLPDVPEAAAFGSTEEEALAAVQPILEAVLSSYCVDGRPIPSPSDVCGAPIVATEKFSLLGLEVPTN